MSSQLGYLVRDGQRWDQKGGLGPDYEGTSPWEGTCVFTLEQSTCPLESHAGNCTRALVRVQGWGVTVPDCVGFESQFHHMPSSGRAPFYLWASNSSLENRDNDNAYCMRSFWGLNELIHGKCLEQCLEHSKHLHVNFYYYSLDRLGFRFRLYGQCSNYILSVAFGLTEHRSLT